MRKPNTDEADTPSKFASILRLRGGEEAKKEASDKIKGCCIGIDLGTTYRYDFRRYAIISNFPTLFPSYLINFHFAVAVWPFGRMGELRSAQTNKEIG